jgi:hypothetical protein
LKPFTVSRFEKAVRKAFDAYNLVHTVDDRRAVKVYNAENRLWGG